MAASAGFFARGGFTFRGVKWRWGWVAVLPFSTTVVLAGRASSAMAGKQGGFGRLFVRGGLTFSGQGGTATLRNHRYFCRVALSAVTGKRGGFGRLFCSWQVYVSRGKVALGLGRGFTSVPVSVLTLHSRGTGRMHTLCGLWDFELLGLRPGFVPASPSI